MLTAFAAIAGCQSWNDIGYIQACDERGAPLAADQTSTLGFAPVDVIRAIDGHSWELSFAAGDDLPAYVTTWTFSWVLDGQPEEVVRDRAFSKCDQGTAVLVPTSVTFSSDDGEWEGGGHTLMEATGTEVDDVKFYWTDCSLPVTSAPDALEDAVADSRGSCSGSPDPDEVMSFCDTSLAGGRVVFHMSYPSCEGGSYSGTFTPR